MGKSVFDVRVYAYIYKFFSGESQVFKCSKDPSSKNINKIMEINLNSITLELPDRYFSKTHSLSSIRIILCI